MNFIVPFRFCSLKTIKCLCNRKEGIFLKDQRLDDVLVTVLLLLKDTMNKATLTKKII